MDIASSAVPRRCSDWTNKKTAKLVEEMLYRELSANHVFNALMESGRSFDQPSRVIEMVKVVGEGDGSVPFYDERTLDARYARGTTSWSRGTRRETYSNSVYQSQKSRKKSNPDTEHSEPVGWRFLPEAYRASETSDIAEKIGQIPLCFEDLTETTLHQATNAVGVLFHDARLNRGISTVNGPGRQNGSFTYLRHWPRVGWIKGNRLLAIARRADQGKDHDHDMANYACGMGDLYLEGFLVVVHRGAVCTVNDNLDQEFDRKAAHVPSLDLLLAVLSPLRGPTSLL
ncbi:hypothetical protein UA08_07504 [Talaromyces atroroseus]|uniref:Uncharacterized protein n=1 Tax=Talaromyces atroroseus TaxID=1441469 RepID=A0A225A8V8_TALAT|nr:hypothetical protein UA08_07504 [Talaromyces atroroseus]OKL57122.1 hypothetical protein UA08_07504 [Talaromyces atroroseus]